MNLVKLVILVKIVNLVKRLDLAKIVNLVKLINLAKFVKLVNLGKPVHKPYNIGRDFAREGQGVSDRG